MGFLLSGCGDVLRGGKREEKELVLESLREDVLDVGGGLRPLALSLDLFLTVDDAG